jgi:hypothetical protein
MEWGRTDEFGREKIKQPDNCCAQPNFASDLSFNQESYRTRSYVLDLIDNTRLELGQEGWAAQNER